MRYIKTLVNPGKLYRALKRRWRGLRPTLYVIEGQVKGSDFPLRVLHIATAESNPSFIGQLALGSHTGHRRIGPVWKQHLTRRIRAFEQPFDLICSDIEFFAPDEAFSIPIWVSMDLDLHLSLDELCRRRPNSFGYLRRRMARYNFTWEISTAPSDIRWFMRHMCTPFAQARFGAQALPLTRAALNKNIHATRLIKLYLEEEWIAGGTITLGEAMPRCSRFGFVSHLDTATRTAANAELYYRQFEQCKILGHTKAGLGFSRGFLSDGVFWYKCRLGAHIIHMGKNRNRSMQLRVVKDTPGVRHFLSNNPFLTHIDGTQNYAAALFDFPGNKTLQSHLKQAVQLGISHITLYSDQPPSPPAEHDAPGLQREHLPVEQVFQPLPADNR